MAEKIVSFESAQRNLEEQQKLNLMLLDLLEQIFERLDSIEGVNKSNKTSTVTMGKVGESMTSRELAQRFKGMKQK